MTDSSDSNRKRHLRRTKADLVDRIEALEREIEGLQGAARPAAPAGDDPYVRFQHIFEHAPIGLALITPEGNRFMVNQALADFLGYGIEELTNTTMGSTAGDDAALAESMRLRQEVMDGKRTTYTNQRPYRRKSGEIVWGEVTGSLVRDEAGAPLYFIAQTVDVTERKRHREALQASEQRFRDYAEVASDWFWEMDADLRYTYVSPAYERIAGKDPAGLIGRTRREMYKGYIAEEREAWAAFLDTLDRHEDFGAFSYTYNRPDGQRRVLSNNGRALFDAEGVFLGYRGIGVDITYEVESLEALKLAKEAADQANRAKSDFLANMSHEIRTPMSAIIGLSDLLAAMDLDAKQRDYVAKIRTSGRNLLGIINDILDFSKIEADMLDIESINFQLTDVIDDVSGSIAMKAEEKGLEVMFVTAPDVPAALVGDPLRLGQVLINLADNAVKFTEKGEVVIRTELAGRDGDDATLRFSVRDTGIGLEAEQIARLFESFTQADGSTTRKYGGSGLGLTISKRLVESMGGAIHAESDGHRGSTFVFTVRCGVQTAALDVAIEAPDVSKLRVLIVDDNATARQILTETLEAMAFPVSEAWSGETALDAIRDADAAGQPFDLVLMDWKMPQMDGVETIRRIAGIPGLSRLPRFFMVTAYDCQEAMAAAGGVDIHACLSKPLNSSHLIDAVMNAFAIRSEPAADEDPGPSAPKAASGARILLVEDNEINQMIAKAVLETAGFEVDVADNGRDALDRLGGAPDAYGAVLMDLQMPEMDGYEATRAIRANAELADLPIIALTAHAFAEEKERCYAAGMNGHISKPLDARELITTLNDLVGA
ncbi:MAG: response regulator [Magnetovibrio sp.]|nr:response regulator [Magnetovibrio sp.]